MPELQQTWTVLLPSMQGKLLCCICLSAILIYFFIAHYLIFARQICFCEEHIRRKGVKYEKNQASLSQPFVGWSALGGLRARKVFLMSTASTTVLCRHYHVLSASLRPRRQSLSPCQQGPTRWFHLNPNS